MKELNPVDVIHTFLLRHPLISQLVLFEPQSPLPLQDRLQLDPEAGKILEQGLAIRQKLGLPFWDSVLVASFGSGEAALPLLRNADFHNLNLRRKIQVIAAQWSQALVDSEVCALHKGNMLVLSSCVQLSSKQTAHIPMLDFHIPSNMKNQKVAEVIARKLDPNGGFLLESGKSYHFYGKSLLTEADFRQFLSHALLFSPVVDRAWIAHQLIENAAGLRISEKEDGGHIPFVVLEL